MTRITISVSKDKLANTQQFIAEVNEAFNSTMPPVGFEIAQKSDIEAFAKIFKSSEHSYYGKRVSCKNAKSFAPSTYSAAEIYTLVSDRFPIELFFKSVQDIEDFAEGYLRAVETMPLPANSDATPKPEQEMKKEDEGVAIRESKDGKVKRQGKYYAVNPFAETLLDTMLKITLVFGWILAIASIGISIFLAIEEDAYFIILLGVLAASLILLLYYTSWAIYKVIINISRNLFNINERLKDYE